MILYINDRLNVWAAWHASGRKVIGLSYPGQCAFTRLTPSAHSNSAPIPDEEAWETEKAIQRLETALRDLIHEVYTKPGTMETHAKALNIGQTCLFDRLHKAHIRIMEWLQVGDDEPIAQKYQLTSPDCIAIKLAG